MASYKEQFIETLKARDIKYIDRDANVLEIRFSAENISTVRILVLFDKDGDKYVQFAAVDICSFKDDKIAAGLVACNEMNNKFRWAKFCLDSSQELVVKADAVLDANSAGEECFELLFRMVGIVDDAYPAFMKALWS